VKRKKEPSDLERKNSISQKRERGGRKRGGREREGEGRKSKKKERNDSKNEMIFAETQYILYKVNM
jgi:hypothetical protein